MNPIIAFLSMPEIVVICVVVLLIFGPKKIPEFARSLGKAKKEFNEAKSAFNDAMEEEEHQPEKKNIAPPAEEEEIITDSKAKEKAEEPSSKA